MPTLLFQTGPPPVPAGVDPLVQWLVGIMLSSLVAVVGILWHQAVAENRRKDELIDRLLKAELENAEANKLSVSLLTEERKKPS